jgi:hypothetical protein
MNLLYDGALSPDVARWAKDFLNSKPHVVEVSNLPPSKDMDAIWADRTYQAETDSMGKTYIVTHPGVAWGYVHKNFGAVPHEGGFLFFPDQDAYDRFVKAFPAFIVNLKPFRTLL